MPIIECSLKDMENLIGIKLPRTAVKLWDIFQYVKTEVEEINGDMIKLDVGDRNRPDLWCSEGIARAIKGALGIKTGLPNYFVGPPKIKVLVDSKIKKIRPYIAAAVVKGLKFNDFLIKQIIQLQEKLDLTYGRRRKKAAVGIYDFDKIKSPIKYTLVSPKGIKFAPLGFEKKLTPEEILEQHPKGIEYGDIVKQYKKYPLLIDKKRNVLSMPPIINSNYVGKITEKTKNVFIEITGTKWETVLNTLNIVTASLIDRGGKAYFVSVKYPKAKVNTPIFKPKEYGILPKDVKKLLGLDLEPREIISLLAKARFGIIKTRDHNLITILAPFYRTDIMHPCDIIEDIAIMYGYSSIKPQKLEIPTFGSISKLEEYSDKIRELLIGFGFQELLNFTLTSKEILFKNMNQKQKDVVEISNPMTENYCVLRHKILPLLINTLSKNTHLSYPQKIFEVGDISEDVKTKKHACVVHAGSNFTDMKSVLDSLMNDLGLKVKLTASKNESFIPGRVANIICENENIGVIGEIHPEVLERNSIIVPVSAFELDVSKLFDFGP